MVEHISVFAFHAANPTIPPLHADDDFYFTVMSLYILWQGGEPEQSEVSETLSFEINSD